MTWPKYVPGLDPLPPKHYNLSCFAVQVDLATGRSLSPAKLVRHDETTGNWVSEGPQFFKRGEWFYLITADGGTHTAHQERVFRSKEGPFGPREEGPRGVNPMIYNGDDPSVSMTGHRERFSDCFTYCPITRHWIWSRVRTGDGGRCVSPFDHGMGGCPS